MRARLEAGNLGPSIRGGVAPAKLIADCEMTAAPGPAAEYRLHFEALEAAKEIMSPEQFNDLGQRVDRHISNARAQCQPRINGNALSARRQRCLRPLLAQRLASEVRTTVGTEGAVLQPVGTMFQR